jgi:ribosomal protein L37E
LGVELFDVMLCDASNSGDHRDPDGRARNAGVDRPQSSIENPLMTSPSTGLTSEPHTQARSSAPDWDNVPFDVHCARCGQDLRGQTEPMCPACGLEFDWAEALPLEELTCLNCGYHLYGLTETRCPECGTPFTWEHVLDAYRLRKQMFFEYQWRRRPVRSLVRTWVWALRPAKLWAKFDIYDPPRLVPLLVLSFVGLAGFWLILGLLTGLDRWCEALWWAAGAGRWADVSEYIVRALSDRILCSVVLTVAVWLAASFASLMILRQSMRLCRVRTVHVLRVWAHAVTLIPAAVVVAGFALWGLVWLLDAAHPAFCPEMRLLPILAVLAYAVWSLRCGYGTYLRMAHAWGVAIATQSMAVLATSAFCLVLLPKGWGVMVLFVFYDFLTLP